MRLGCSHELERCGCIVNPVNGELNLGRQIVESMHLAMSLVVARILFDLMKVAKGMKCFHICRGASTLLGPNFGDPKVVCRYTHSSAGS